VRKAENIFWLGIKELRSVLHDFVLLGLVIYSFSLAVVMQARSNSQELHNASIAFVDEDNSELSRRIAHAFLPPYFQLPQQIVEKDVVSLMNKGKYTFVVDIPPEFEQYVLARRQPVIQVDVDATAMVQAGLGSGYAEQIITTEVADFLSHSEGIPLSTVNLDVRIAFNPNLTTAWFTTVMGIINNVTMLAIILAGAAIVREREHGTMDHLLVMPLTPFEIAMSKVAHPRYSLDARGPDRGFNPAVHAWCRDLSVFCHRDRHLPGNLGTVDAATGTAVHVGLPADEYAFRKQHAAREHAVMACDRDASLAVDPFRAVCAVDPLPRRRNRSGVAAVSRGRRGRWVIFWLRNLALPLGRRAIELIHINFAQRPGAK
jgi:hypothetical protein